MKSSIMVLAVVLLMAPTVGAQIVLNPPSTTGGTLHGNNWGTAISSVMTTSTAPLFVAARKYMIFSSSTTQHMTLNWNGVFEFGMTGLPTSEMTTSNFTAQLTGVSALLSMSTGYGSMQIDLRDMADWAEDNTISTLDVNAAAGPIVASASHVFGISPAAFGSTNVTHYLRRDLFGAGMGGASTGFILESHDYAIFNGCFFPQDAPTLIITVYPDGGAPDSGPWDGGTYPPLDAGSDTDTDTDTDSDSDSDTDYDDDSDTDYDDGYDDDFCGSDVGVCWCRAVGTSDSATSLFGLFMAII